MANSRKSSRQVAKKIGGLKVEIVLAIHFFSCCFMTGAIWLVQALVYPNFNLVGMAEFEKFHHFHMRRITWVVAPVMALELLTAVGIFFKFQSSLFFWNLVSVLLVWILTVFVNVRTHDHLKFALQDSKKNLVLRNWPRTFIWTGRAVFLTWVLMNSEKVLN